VLGEAARPVVQRHAVEVAHADDGLQQVAGALLVGAVARDEQGRGEGEGAPCQLFCTVMVGKRLELERGAVLWE
jgi:hypothetical protein